LGLIALREIDHLPTAGCEFFVTLGRSGKGGNLSRQELLDEIARETSLVTSQPCRHSA
jgi:hypothetical protein